MKSSTFFSFIFVCLIYLCTGCSWVDDDRSDCPTGHWLKLSYTYNMLNVDAASTQLKDITIFIVDQNKNLVEQMEIDSVTLHQNNCLIQLPSLPPAKYTFLVWGGLEDKHYTCISSGVQYSCRNIGDLSHRISSLFYGRLDSVHVGNEYKLVEVPLVKNTNTFSCILQSATKNRMTSDEFSMKLTARNGLLNYRNIPSDTTSVCYMPFAQESMDMENLQVVHAGLNTLRLMENDSTLFTLTHKPSGQEILNIPLCQYLLLSRQAHAATMEAQEYLDRQDQYNLIFFLVPTENPQSPFLCMHMEVNGWRVRLNNAELGEAAAPWGIKMTN